jgi:hypothetical protein
MWHLKKFRNVAKGTQKSVLWVTSASVGQQGSSRYIEKTKLTHVVLMYGPMSVGVLIMFFSSLAKKKKKKVLPN